MNLNKKHEVPILFFNAGDEDRKAYFSLLASKIECEFRAAAEEPTPLLLVGYQRFLGLAEIRKFISECEQKSRLSTTSPS